jgi:trigger factor
MMETTAESSEVLNDENVRFTIHHKPGCTIEYDVEALAKLVKEAHKGAVKAVSKEVSLPGFRKGRVPEALIIKNFKSEIDKAWQQEIATLSFQACQRLSKYRPLQADTKVQFNMKSHSESGALLTLGFETAPRIPNVDPQALQLKPVKRPEVNAQKVAETIRQIQLFFASWTKVIDRPVQEGDFVLLDVDIIEEEPPSPLFSDTRFEVTQSSMAKWMYDLVLGKTFGETLEGVSVPDDSASEEDKKTLTPKKVRLTIKSIDTAAIPELDESLLKMLGVSSFDELETKVTALLNKQADEHVKEAQRSQVNDLLLSVYPFELPATLINDETRFRFKQLGQDPDFQNYWNTLSQEERNKLFTLIHTQAEKAVRLFYLCQNIRTVAQISISAEDIPPPVSNPLELLLNPQKMHHHQRTPEIEHAEAYSRVLLEKTVDYLIANASQQLE